MYWSQVNPKSTRGRTFFRFFSRFKLEKYLLKWNFEFVFSSSSSCVRVASLFKKFISLMSFPGKGDFIGGNRLVRQWTLSGSYSGFVCYVYFELLNFLYRKKNSKAKLFAFDFPWWKRKSLKDKHNKTKAGQWLTESCTLLCVFLSHLSIDLWDFIRFNISAWIK